MHGRGDCVWRLAAADRRLQRASFQRVGRLGSTIAFMKHVIAGVSLGLFFGAAWGAALHNLPLGIALGVALGVPGGLLLSGSSATSARSRRSATAGIGNSSPGPARRS